MNKCKCNQKQTNLPFEYLLLEWALDIQEESARTVPTGETFKQRREIIFHKVNEALRRRRKTWLQTFVLSRITNRRVVLRGLNRRIMTYKQTEKQTILFDKCPLTHWQRQLTRIPEKLSLEEAYWLLAPYRYHGTNCISY